MEGEDDVTSTQKRISRSHLLFNSALDTISALLMFDHTNGPFPNSKHVNPA